MMPAINKTWLVHALGLLFLSGPVSAGFQDIPASVKAEAMGGAFVAMAGDAGAAFINPAGLSGLKSSEFAMMYGKPLAGLEGINLNEGYLAFGTRLGKSCAMSVNSSFYQAAGMFNEYQSGVSGSLLLTPQIAVGAGAAYLYHKYTIASDPAYSSLPVFADGNSRGAVGVNLGVLASLTPELRLGASVRNLNRPDVGLQEKDPVAREIRLGGMYSMPYARVQLELQESDDGLGNRDSRAETWKAGAEVPLNSFYLRAGASSDAFTAGFGTVFGGFVLDYAFAILRSVSATNYGSQFLALTYRIGPGDAADSSPARRKREKQKKKEKAGVRSSNWQWLLNP
jgi:hypothetical protein